MWKKEPQKPQVSSKYCDYVNKVSILQISEYLSLNI